MNLYLVWSDLAEPTMTKVLRYGSEEQVALIHWSSLGHHKVAVGYDHPHKISKLLETGPIYNE